MSNPENHTNLDPPSGSSGRSPVPAVLLIVALSVVLFFTVTLPMCKTKNADPLNAAAGQTAGPEGQVATPQAAQSTPGDAGPASPVADPTGKPATPAPEKKPPVVQHASGRALARDFASRIRSGKLPEALDLIPDEAMADHGAERLRSLFTRGNYRVSEEKGVVEIGQIDNLTRYGVNLTREEGDGLPADRIRLLLDVKKDAPRGNWRIAKVHIPSFTALAAPMASAGAGAAASADNADSTPGPLPESLRKPGPVEGTMTVQGDAATEEESDPLTLAYTFVEAVIDQDFAKAKSLIDTNEVTEEKLAGLFIVSEEAGFKMREEQPLVATAAQPNRAWVIAQLGASGLLSDFGLEIAKDPASPSGWKIVGLNFSKLIADRASASGADAVTYTPIIQSPQGGESLVLYFEYDTVKLHTRAQRQIDIIANILKADPAKKIHINGHTDAKGSEDYNEDLSDSRAGNVSRALTAAGVSPAQIITRAYGETKPVSPNILPDGSDNPEGRKRNRRAEVYLDF